MSEATESNIDPERSRPERPRDRVNRFLDRFISARIRGKGQGETGRARILLIQSLTVALIGLVSMTYQATVGVVILGGVGFVMILAAICVPIALRRAKSHVWVGGLLTGTLFVALSLANVMTAGRGVAPAVFIAAIPLMGTLTQGVRWGAFWAVLTLGELSALQMVASAGIEPILEPADAAARFGYLRSSLLLTILITASGLLHAIFNEYAARRVAASEEDVARSQANYREMLDTLPDGLFSVSQDERIDFVNQTLVTMLGYESAKELQGRRVEDFLTGIDVDALRKESTERGRSSNAECEVVDSSGQTIPVEVATTHIFVHGDRGQVFRLRDIRDFRRANREAQILRTTFDQAPTGVSVLEMDSTVLYANDAYLDLTQYSREQLIGKRLLDLSSSDYAHRVVKEVQAALERGETVTYPKMNWARFDARPGYVEVRSFAIHPPGEAQRRWVTFIRDVTSMVELEREVARSERIDSLGKLAGGIAHDFNNLLTVIRGQVDILEEDLETDHWGHGYLATIAAACDRSAALTGKVLDFSRKQILLPQVFLADDAIRNLIPILRQLVPERIALDVAVDGEGESRVRCDPSRFDQILLNLVANARDAIDGSGRVTIRVAVCAAKDEDEGALAEVEIAVSDDGKGMPSEVQDKIFDPFFTTKPSSEGTGLGLSTVHGIVHQSGGRIQISSKPGEGTTMHVFLPSTDAPLTQNISHRPAAASPWQDRQGTVLVVEDNVEVRDFVTEAVERLGYRSLSAQNGREARSWIEDRSETFEALVSDIVMPGSSGVEVARLFRSRFANKRIVLMSGYAEDEIGPIEQLPSDIRFIQKPVSSRLLEVALTEA